MSKDFTPEDQDALKNGLENLQIPQSKTDLNQNITIILNSGRDLSSWSVQIRKCVLAMILPACLGFVLMSYVGWWWHYRYYWGVFKGMSTTRIRIIPTEVHSERFPSYFDVVPYFNWYPSSPLFVETMPIDDTGYIYSVYRSPIKLPLREIQPIPLIVSFTNQKQKVEKSTKQEKKP